MDGTGQTPIDADGAAGAQWIRCCDHCGCPPKRRDGHDDSCAHGCNDAEIAGGARMTLTEFLLARIAEDEQPTTHRRPRVLAECEAKREIVALHECVDYGTHEGIGQVFMCRECRDQRGPCQTLRLLALPRSGHPDYAPEWKP